MAARCRWCVYGRPRSGGRSCCRATGRRPAILRHAAGGEIATARPEPGGASWNRLAAEAEAADDLAVALHVVVADVVEEAAAAADELQEPAPGVVVALVHLEVLGQVDDALAQDGDLHLGGAGVRLVEAVLGDRGLLVWHVGNRPLESWWRPTDGTRRPGNGSRKRPRWAD